MNQNLVGTTYAMEGYVVSFFKAEWKVCDTGSTHWASSLNLWPYGQSIKIIIIK
jgi:hypothetical protein